MTRPHIAMRKIREVLRLSLGQGLNLRQVAASAQVPYTTVADYLRRAGRPGWPGHCPSASTTTPWTTSCSPSEPARERPSGAGLGQGAHRTAPARGHAHAFMARAQRGLPRRLLLHPVHRALPGLEARHRRRHAPGPQGGREAFRRLPGPQVPIYDARTGQVAHQAELFVAALGASNFMYAEALVSQELMYWVTAHVHTFEA